METPKRCVASVQNKQWRGQVRPDFTNCSDVSILDLKLLASSKLEIKIFWIDAEKNNPDWELFIIFPKQNLVLTALHTNSLYIDIKIVKTWDFKQIAVNR